MTTEKSTSRQGQESDGSFNQLTPLECPHCEHSWPYTGSLEKATCPSCQLKISVPENRTDAVDTEESVFLDRLNDGGLDDIPEATATFPVTVPPEIEAMARERFGRHCEVTGEVSDHQRKFEEFLQDQVELRPQFLTREVVNREYGEPVDHALYSCVTADQHEDIVEHVRESDDVDTVQEFVRKAVLAELGR